MKQLPAPISRFASNPFARRAALFLAVLAFSLVDWGVSGQVRRSYRFREVRGGHYATEIRYLPRVPGGLEAEAAFYVREYLLGPSSIEYDFLFTKGTTLDSFMVRGDRAYVDLSQEAALPVGEQLDLRRSVVELRSGLLRNFPGLGGVEIFIAGREPYAAGKAETSSEIEADGGEPKKTKGVDK